MIAATADTSGWQPHTEYDLFEGDPTGFAQTLKKFREWAKDQPRNPINLDTGWHVLEGQKIEDLLIRNRHNRPVRFHTVVSYATSLLNGRWKRTGQGIIITDKEDLEDGQHRLLAAYLTKKPLPIYVLTGVESIPDLFAYLDNIQSRTGEDALNIAGLNGLSKHIATVIKDIGIHYDENMLGYSGRFSIPPITNVDVLEYARAHPSLAQAAHIVKDLYSAAAGRLYDQKVATFVAWKVRDTHGEDALETFMSMLTQEGLAATNPVAVLRKRLEEHEAALIAPKGSPKRKQRLTQVQILALTIKAFNLMMAGANVRRLDPRADDPYPRFDEPENAVPSTEAAQ